MFFADKKINNLVFSSGFEALHTTFCSIKRNGKSIPPPRSIPFMATFLILNVFECFFCCFLFVAVLLTTKPRGAKGLHGLSTKKKILVLKNMLVRLGLIGGVYIYYTFRSSPPPHLQHIIFSPDDRQRDGRGGGGDTRGAVAPL